MAIQHINEHLLMRPESYGIELRQRNVITDKWEHAITLFKGDVVPTLTVVMQNIVDEREEAYERYAHALSLLPKTKLREHNEWVSMRIKKKRMEEISKLTGPAWDRVSEEYHQLKRKAQQLDNLRDALNIKEA